MAHRRVEPFKLRMQPLMMLFQPGDPFKIGLVSADKFFAPGRKHSQLRPKPTEHLGIINGHADHGFLLLLTKLPGQSDLEIAARL